MTTIAPATERDAAGIAKVYVDAWRSAYAAILPHRVLLGMSYEQQTRQWSWTIRDERQSVIVATDADHGVVGFIGFGRARLGDRLAIRHFAGEHDAKIGEIFTRSMSSRTGRTTASAGTLLTGASPRWRARVSVRFSLGPARQSFALFLRARWRQADRRGSGAAVGLHDRPGLLRLARPHAGDCHRALPR